MAKKVVILGGPGNALEIATAIASAGQQDWEVAGFLNDREPAGTTLNGFPVLGPLKLVPQLIAEGYFFINTILRIDGQQYRIDLFNSLNIPEKQLATFVHPQAYVAPTAQLGPGCVVMPLASVSAASRLGKSCLVMQGATITHDNQIGSFCHFAANSVVAGYVTIADGVHIGLGASVRENCKIGRNSALGMGAVLLNDIGEEEIWVGNPAKFLRKVKN